MRVLVIGSTGGSGRAAVLSLARAGHQVTAFSRGRPADLPAGVEHVQGDALDAGDVERAMVGKEAVVVTLGISENPLRVRFFGPRHTPLDVRSRGTRNVMSAMKKHGVKKLVVQTSYGVGDTRERLRLADRLFFALLLKPQIADTELQNRDVRQSDLDWVIVQPVHLTDRTGEDAPLVSLVGDTGLLSVSRESVGHVLAEAVSNASYVRRSLSVSGAPLAS